jgi:hypothetical protein
METTPGNQKSICQQVNNPIHHRLISKQNGITIINIASIRDAYNEVPFGNDKLIPKGFQDDFNNPYQAT